MKVHLKSAHVCWNDCLAQVVERTRLMKRMIVKPCVYCLDQVFDTQTHWKRCHVLMICCFIEVYARSHDTCTVGSHSSTGSALAGASQSVRCGTGESHVPAPPLRVHPENNSCPIRETSSGRSREGGDGGRTDAGSGLGGGPLSAGAADLSGSSPQGVVQRGQRQGEEQGSRQGLRQAQLRQFFSGRKPLEHGGGSLLHGSRVHDGANGSHATPPREAVTIPPTGSEAPFVSASGSAGICRSAYGQGCSDLARADGQRQGPLLASRNDASRV